MQNEDKIILCSDFHCGHANIIKFCNRPFKDTEEMYDALVENCNKVATKDCILYMLGDMVYRSSDFTKTIEQLRKDLECKNWVYIKGNHDGKEVDKYQKSGLCKFPIKDYEELRVNKQKIILSHYPFLSWNGMNHGGIHFYGHSHSMGRGFLPNSLDVGVDSIAYLLAQKDITKMDKKNYRPVSLTEAKELICLNQQSKK